MSHVGPLTFLCHSAGAKARDKTPEDKILKPAPRGVAVLSVGVSGFLAYLMCLLKYAFLVPEIRMTGVAPGKQPCYCSVIGKTLTLTGLRPFEMFIGEHGHLTMGHKIQ